MRHSGAERAHALRRTFARRTTLLLLLATACVPSFCQSATNPRSNRDEFTRRLVAAAIERTHHSVRYVSDYAAIPYPGGDVPDDTGVCTDEVIRSYRVVGVDLQKEVHEDMVSNFDAYPHGRQRHPDKTIDHRRVPNLMVFFSRKGEKLPMTTRPEDYSPRRHCRVGPRQRNHPHWNCRGSARAQRSLHDRPQHRPRPADGRCAV
jgi:uncharacterized protein YijF (DUF1287 family)